MEKDEYSKKYPWVNRRVNILYLLLSVVDLAIDDLDSQLKVNKLELFRNDKVLLKNIIATSKSLQNGIQKLINNTVYQSLTMTEGEKNLYEDSSIKLYVMIMAMLDRSGNDKYDDLRLYSLTKMILGYKSLLQMPNLKHQFLIAFQDVIKEIKAGKYSADVMKKLFEKNEEVQ